MSEQGSTATIVGRAQAPARQIGGFTQTFTDGLSVTAIIEQGDVGELLIRVRIDREGAQKASDDLQADATAAPVLTAAPPELIARADLVRSIEVVRDDCGITAGQLAKMVKARFKVKSGLGDLNPKQLGLVLEGLLLRRRQLEIAAAITAAVTEAGIVEAFGEFLAIKHGEKKLADLTIEEQKEVARHFLDVCGRVLEQIEAEEKQQARAS